MNQEFKKILFELIKDFPNEQQKLLIEIFENSSQSAEKLINNLSKKNENEIITNQRVD